MPDTSVILDHLLPADAVQLGNLITSVKYPEHDFCESDQHPANAEITSTRVLDFTYSAEKLKGTGFHAALTILLSGSQNRKDENRISISSATCVTQQLRDSSAFFETLCQSRRARAWLERAIRKRQTVYFVTGVKTVTDAKVNSEKTKGGDVSTDVTLPMALIASSAAGVPLPFEGGALNAGVGVISSRSTSDATSFTAPREKIFAIQCRKIRFSFFSSHEVDNAALADGAQWSIFLGERGEDEVDEETLNAALGESVQKEDLRGGKYEALDVDGEVFIYASDKQPGMMAHTQMQPSGSNQGQNGFQQPFPPQLQHQMQASPLPMTQNPSSMEMENPGLQSQAQPQQRGIPGNADFDFPQLTNQQVDAKSQRNVAKAKGSSDASKRFDQMDERQTTIKAGIFDVNGEDDDGQTPLLQAAKNGHDAMVKLLLDFDEIDVNSRDKKDQTPLSWAVKNGHRAVVKLLLETDEIEVDSKDNDGRTPLSWAAGNGHDAIFKLLLETGKVDVDVRDNYGLTPLYYAAAKGCAAIVELLIETGEVDVDITNGNGSRPLHPAAHKGYEAVVKLLLDTGKVDVNSKNIEGNGALEFAKWGGHQAVIKLLHETGSLSYPFNPTQTDVRQVFADLQLIRLASGKNLPPELALSIVSMGYRPCLTKCRALERRYRANDFWEPGPRASVAGLYLSTECVPSADSALGFFTVIPQRILFQVMARDEGEGTHGKWCVSFEASILRPIGWGSGGDIPLEEALPETWETPSSASKALKQKGWDFVSKDDGQITWKVCSNAGTGKNYRLHKVEWRRGCCVGTGEGFLELLQPGHVVVLWARAEDEFWQNHVKAAEIEIEYELR